MSPNQIVYTNNGEGNQVPIGIIINGSFSPHKNNPELPLGYETDEVVHQEWHWIAGQEECVTNEEKEDTPFIKSEEVNEDMEEDTKITDDEEFIKVYKRTSSKKRTLKTLKRNRQLKINPKKSSKKCHIQGMKQQVVTKLQKTFRRIKRRKRISDSAYQPPQSAKKRVMTGKLTCFRRQSLYMFQASFVNGSSVKLSWPFSLQ